MEIHLNILQVPEKNVGVGFLYSINRDPFIGCLSSQIQADAIVLGSLTNSMNRESIATMGF